MIGYVFISVFNCIIQSNIGAFNGINFHYPSLSFMKKIIVCALFISFILAINNECFAQKDVLKAKGESKFRIESWMSLDAAKEKALEEAIVNAIEEQFPSYVEQESTITVADGDTKFNLKGKRSVRGEWLKHTKDIKYNFYEELIDKKSGLKENWIQCNVEGLIREITRSRAFWEAQPLNCPMIQCRQTIFKNRENFYLYFKASLPGYFSIYYSDGENVYRLLPYYNMPARYMNAVPVKQDKEYIFFSGDKKHNYFKDFESSEIQPLEMITEEDNGEELKLYLIFGTKEYVKPILGEAIYIRDDYKLPEYLTQDQFDRWIADLRVNDYDFAVQELYVKIQKK